jgi:hypothetical protein
VSDDRLARAETVLRAAAGPRVRSSFPLAPLTSFRLGGPAALYVEAESDRDLGGAAEAVAASGIPWTIIGKGSNLLVSDAGWAGLRLGKGTGERRGRAPRSARRGDAPAKLSGAPQPRWAGIRGRHPGDPRRRGADERRAHRRSMDRGAVGGRLLGPRSSDLMWPRRTRASSTGARRCPRAPSWSGRPRLTRKTKPAAIRSEWKRPGPGAARPSRSPSPTAERVREPGGRSRCAPGRRGGHRGCRGHSTGLGEARELRGGFPGGGGRGLGVDQARPALVEAVGVCSNGRCSLSAVRRICGRRPSGHPALSVDLPAGWPGADPCGGRGRLHRGVPRPSSACADCGSRAKPSAAGSPAGGLVRHERGGRPDTLGRTPRRDRGAGNGGEASRRDRHLHEGAWLWPG